MIASHAKKALLPIVVKASERIRKLSLRHAKKALLSTLVTVLRSVRDVSPLSVNAPLL